MQQEKERVTRCVDWDGTRRRSPLRSLFQRLDRRAVVGTVALVFASAGTIGGVFVYVSRIHATETHFVEVASRAESPVVITVSPDTRIEVAAAVVSQPQPPMPDPTVRVAAVEKPATSPSRKRNTSQSGATSAHGDASVSNLLSAYAVEVRPAKGGAVSAIEKFAPSTIDGSKFDKPRTGSVSSSVNMRREASLSSTVLRILRPGQKISVIACAEWCEIERNGLSGFIHADYVEGI